MVSSAMALALAPTPEPLGRGQVRLRIHGPDPANDELSASVFADKIGTLVKACRAADKAVNGGKATHDYMIFRLASSTPTVILAERPLPRLRDQMITGHSGVSGFQSCVEAITSGDRERALSFGTCATQIGRLSRGARKSFGYAEVWTQSDEIIRVDPFLSERVLSVIRDEPQPALKISQFASESEWFEGQAHGSFEGEVRAVDLRGALPELKLILSAGGKQIDCVCRSIQIDDIRNALNRRVRVSGIAIYDGKSGLPRRLEANSIQPIADIALAADWKGSFEAFEIEPWGDER